MGAAWSHSESAPGPEADVVWLADAVACPRAGRAFAAGELVERSACVALLSVTLEGCFLQDYCFELPQPTNGGAVCPKVQLFPLGGWAPLLCCAEEAHDANLTVEHSCEALAAQARPGGQAEEAEEPVQHWLSFRAARPLAAGERLRAPPRPRAGRPSPRGTAYAAALAELAARCPSCAAAGPAAARRVPLARRRGSAVEAAASRVHGLGVLAARDVAAGEALEVAPVLPVALDGISRSPLREYAIHPPGGDDAPLAAAGVVLLPLGTLGLFNHAAGSSGAGVAVRQYRGHPWLLECVSLEAQAAGSELLVGYGAAYWELPWRRLSGAGQP